MISPLLVEVFYVVLLFSIGMLLPCPVAVAFLDLVFEFFMISSIFSTPLGQFWPETSWCSWLSFSPYIKSFFLKAPKSIGYNPDSTRSFSYRVLFFTFRLFIIRCFCTHSSCFHVLLGILGPRISQPYKSTGVIRVWKRECHIFQSHISIDLYLFWSRKRAFHPPGVFSLCTYPNSVFRWNVAPSICTLGLLLVILLKVNLGYFL